MNLSACVVKKKIEMNIRDQKSNWDLCEMCVKKRSRCEKNKKLRHQIVLVVPEKEK